MNNDARNLVALNGRADRLRVPVALPTAERDRGRSAHIQAGQQRPLNLESVERLLCERAGVGSRWFTGADFCRSAVGLRLIRIGPSNRDRRPL